MPETMAAENRLLFRADYLSYMQTVLHDPGIHLIGEGFTNLAESKNPTEYSRKYIHERTQRNDVTGYSSAFEYSTDGYTNDPVVLEIMAITDQELIGTDTRRTIYCVNSWEKGNAEGSCVAYKREYAIIPGGKADGTDALIYTGSLKACGDFVKIDWDPKTNQPIEP